MENSGFYLDAVVTMVDAIHIERHLPAAAASGLFGSKSGTEAEAQIAFADIVVISKADKVEPDRVVSIRESISRLVLLLVISRA